MASKKSSSIDWLHAFVLIRSLRSDQPKEWDKALVLIKQLSSINQLDGRQHTPRDFLLACAHPTKKHLFVALMNLDTHDEFTQDVLDGAVKMQDAKLVKSMLQKSPSLDDNNPFLIAITAVSRSDVDEDDFDTDEDYERALQKAQRNQCAILKALLQKSALQPIEKIELTKEAFMQARQDLFDLLYPHSKMFDLSSSIAESNVALQRYGEMVGIYNANSTRSALEKSLKSDHKTAVLRKPSKM